jgi:alkanesulfonate monooxygenase SsuD/methylene tetrahydromethanopterin reductase-like flavin-dependent oxidoreductase (luciferase family)
MGISVASGRRGEGVARLWQACRRALVLGDPDTVGEQIQTKVVGVGLDGMIANLPAGGHDLESVALAGETLRKVLAPS